MHLRRDKEDGTLNTARIIISNLIGSITKKSFMAVIKTLSLSLMFAGGILIMLFGINSCSDMPYTGSMLQPGDVDKYLFSPGDGRICLTNGFETACLTLVPKRRDGTIPIIHIYPSSIKYIFYHEGVPILQAERLMDTTEIVEQIKDAEEDKQPRDDDIVSVDIPPPPPPEDPLPVDPPLPDTGNGEGQPPGDIDGGGNQQPPGGNGGGNNNGGDQTPGGNQQPPGGQQPGGNQQPPGGQQPGGNQQPPGNTGGGGNQQPPGGQTPGGNGGGNQQSPGGQQPRDNGGGNQQPPGNTGGSGNGGEKNNNGGDQTPPGNTGDGQTPPGNNNPGGSENGGGNNNGGDQTPPGNTDGDQQPPGGNGGGKNNNGGDQTPPGNINPDDSNPGGQQPRDNGDINQQPPGNTGGDQTPPGNNNPGNNNPGNNNPPPNNPNPSGHNPPDNVLSHLVYGHADDDPAHYKGDGWVIWIFYPHNYVEQGHPRGDIDIGQSSGFTLSVSGGTRTNFVQTSGTCTDELIGPPPPFDSVDNRQPGKDNRDDYDDTPCGADGSDYSVQFFVKSGTDKITITITWTHGMYAGQTQRFNIMKEVNMREYDTNPPPDPGHTNQERWN